MDKYKRLYISICDNREKAEMCSESLPLPTRDTTPREGRSKFKMGTPSARATTVQPRVTAAEPARKIKEIDSIHPKREERKAERSGQTLQLQVRDGQIGVK